MRQRSYGQDAGLTIRMAFIGFLLLLNIFRATFADRWNEPDLPDRNWRRDGGGSVLRLG